MAHMVRGGELDSSFTATGSGMAMAASRDGRWCERLAHAVRDGKRAPSGERSSHHAIVVAWR